MRKTFGLLLVTGMLLFTVGCSGGGDASNTTTNTTTNTVATPATPATP
jgi:hypothetical protein